MSRSYRRLLVLPTVGATFALLGSMMTSVSAAPVSHEPVTAPAAHLAATSHRPVARHVLVRVAPDGHLTLKLREKGVWVPMRTLAAGRYTFDVAGHAAWVQLARPVKGYTRPEYVRDLARSDDAAGSKEFTALTARARFAGGTMTLEPGKQSFTTTLHRGTYWLSNMFTAETAAEVRTITVTGRTPESAFPTVAGTLVARSSGWLKPKSLPGRHGAKDSAEVLLVNRGRIAQQLILMPALPGINSAGYRQLARRATTAGLPQFEFAISGIVAPDTSFVWRYSLPKGTYVMFDFSDSAPEAALPTVTLR